MTAKKKTPKKLNKKSKGPSSKSLQGSKSRIRKKPKKKGKASAKAKQVIDDMLLKMAPQVQKQLDQIKLALEKTPAKVETLKMLGYKVLEHAKELSASIKRKNKGIR